MNDKVGLRNQILPAVELNLNNSGIIVSSERMLEARLIPWDQSGRCRECKATETEVDYMVTKEGVTVWSTRIKGERFVPFDQVHDLPGYTFIKLKNKARVFNVTHGCAETQCPPQPQAFFTIPPPQTKMDIKTTPPPPPAVELEQPALTLPARAEPMDISQVCHFFHPNF